MKIEGQEINVEVVTHSSPPGSKKHRPINKSYGNYQGNKQYRRGWIERKLLEMVFVDFNNNFSAFFLSPKIKNFWLIDVGFFRRPSLHQTRHWDTSFLHWTRSGIRHFRFLFRGKVRRLANGCGRWWKCMFKFAGRFTRWRRRSFLEMRRKSINLSASFLRKSWKPRRFLK